MLRALVEKYYTEDDLNEEQLSQIQKCWQNAEKVLPTNTVQIYSKNRWLHDWYVCGISVYCEQKKKCCRITFSKGLQSIALLCSGVESILIAGEWVSPLA